jgi:GST-like protein
LLAPIHRICAWTFRARPRRGRPRLADQATPEDGNVKRLVDEITARPATAKAIALKDKFTFKAEMDDEARNILFGHQKTRAA